MAEVHREMPEHHGAEGRSEDLRRTWLVTERSVAFRIRLDHRGTIEAGERDGVFAARMSPLVGL